jgi:hypothetical protein
MSTITKDVAVRLSMNGADGVKAQLSTVTEAADKLGTKTAVLTIDAKDDDWEADAAAVLAQAKELGATKVRIAVTADSAGAKNALERIRLNADELGLKKVAIKVNVDDTEAKAKLAGLGTEVIGADVFSGLAGAVSSSLSKGVTDGTTQGASEVPKILAPVFENPEIAGGLAAGIAAALPFLSQLIGSGIVAGFGAGIAGIAILGASKSKQVQDSFASLKTNANKDLSQIGGPFRGVLDGLVFTAQGTLNKMTGTFTKASGTISKSFGSFGSSLISAFASPQVQKSILAVANAFSKILDSVTPQLAGDVNKVAGAITQVSNAVAKNPKAISGFVTGLTDIAVFGLKAIAVLTSVAGWIEGHWSGIYDLVVKPFLNSVSPILGSIGKVMAVIKGVPGAIKKALDLGSLLVQAGKDIIGGLLRGLQSAANGVLGWVKNFASSISSTFGSMLRMASPSKVFEGHGLNIVLGLAGGIQGNSGIAVAATRNLAGLVSGGLVKGLDAGMPGLTAQLARVTAVVAHSPVGAGAVAAGGSQSFNVQIGSGGNDDLTTALVKVLRENIRITSGGNVQKWATGR